MKRNRNFDERYGTAAMLLMARSSGYIRLDGSREPYDAFYGHHQTSA